MQVKSFMAKDRDGHQYKITCSRSHIGKTNKWGVWDCYTEDGKHVTPIDIDKGEFQIIDIGEPLIKSLKPNPLK